MIKALRIGLELLVFVLVALLGYLDSDIIREYDQQKAIWAPVLHFLYHNKVLIGVPASFILATLTLVGQVVLPRQKLEYVRDRILREMRSEEAIFNPESTDIRLTIFVPAPLLGAIWLHLRDFGLWIFKFRKMGCVRPRIGNYLISAQRNGVLFPKARVYFFIDKDTPARTNGIAGHIWHTGGAMMRPLEGNDLPDISSVSLKGVKHIDRLPRNVSKYMRLGKVDYPTLVRLNRRSGYFYGECLYNNGTKIGVLLIDTGREYPITMEGAAGEDARKRFRHYAAIIGETM